MPNNYKPGGGNKLQPYIPAGNGEKSGEYTDNPDIFTYRNIKHCLIRNIYGKCNFLNSSLVGKVDRIISHRNHTSIPSTNRPFSVVKKILNGYVVTERYYNSKGEAYLDIDYTCHGNPHSHPVVPHIHKWHKDEDGCLKRDKKWVNFE